MPDERSLGLRERKKLDTRKALSDAAVELMYERGLDNVLREDIAARAGVSLRTFSNYFAASTTLALSLNNIPGKRARPAHTRCVDHGSISLGKRLP